MSAQHIYHTALPLSPETSILRSRFLESHPSWEEDWTTQQALFSSIPATWGPILRTIKADSGGFTHVTTAGQRIITVCKDNTVNVYDGVTGVLKVSLNARRQVMKAEGSPDGTILFFAHQRAREITVWDTQTGGLIYTLPTILETSDIAVSLKGKYLASYSPDGNFRFWEVENRRGDSHSLGQAILDICWLEPEDRVALALKEVVMILEVATGRKLRTFRIGGSVKRIAFSAGQRRLAILSAIGIKDEIKIIDIRTGSASASSPLTGLTCFTFSGNGDRVICATNTGNLRDLSISAHPFNWSGDLGRLGTIHSMSLLRSGHLVANVGGSIQLLEKEYTRLPSISLDSETPRVYQLDDGKAICASFRDHQDANLLDMETMRDLIHCHLRPDECDASFKPRFICASIDHRIAVLSFSKLHLRLYNIGGAGYRWKSYSWGPVLLGAVSPDGEKLAIVRGREGPTSGRSWEVAVQRVSDGDILTSHVVQKSGPPSNIAFTSETQFYTEDRRVFSAPPPDEDESNSENNRVQTTLTTSTTSKRPLLHPHVRKPAVRRLDKMPISTKDSEGPSRTGVRYKECCVRRTFSLQAPWPQNLRIKEISGEEILLDYPYALGDSLEWVVDAKSRKVCWLPPGYISGIEDGHFFVGSSIVMGGQDGIVRRLTFRNPSSDSWCYNRHDMSMYS
jgi:WD40 repeat protein